MARWLWMTGGLLIWLVQFCGLYALTSLADVLDDASDSWGRWTGGLFSLACLIACVMLLLIALRRRRRVPDFADDMAALCAGLGAVAVIWQALPLLLGT